MERLIYEVTATLGMTPVVYRLTLPAEAVPSASASRPGAETAVFDAFYGELIFGADRFAFFDSRLSVTDALGPGETASDALTILAGTDLRRVGEGLEPLPIEAGIDLVITLGTPGAPAGSADAFDGVLPRAIETDALGETTLALEDRRGGASGFARTDEVAIEVRAVEALTRAEALEVAYLYETGLDRDGAIDLAGLNFWIDAREGGLDVIGMAGLFLGSPEFAERFGDPDGFDDQGLVALFYRNVLGREGEAAGVAFWTEAVADPAFSRAALLYFFAVSEENTAGLVEVEDLAEIEPGFWAFGLEA